jgi:hypothetical protein
VAFIPTPQLYRNWDSHYNHHYWGITDAIPNSLDYKGKVRKEAARAQRAQLTLLEFPDLILSSVHRPQPQRGPSSGFATGQFGDEKSAADPEPNRKRQEVVSERVYKKYILERGRIIAFRVDLPKSTPVNGGQMQCVVRLPLKSYILAGLGRLKRPLPVVPRHLL